MHDVLATTELEEELKMRGRSRGGGGELGLSDST